ncbi:hypothetical protein QYM36_011221 [Artemia franciscana]|uniref:C-type lectin domain-containing protein n=1 Tax=Artemia franciscana TaxID=6661 RepID=A0AA88HUR7_ARTSF|nr:hypothetical protein QYM36_011221 [Artemia franciscana]
MLEIMEADYGYGCRDYGCENRKKDVGGLTVTVLLKRALALKRAIKKNQSTVSDDLGGAATLLGIVTQPTEQPTTEKPLVTESNETTSLFSTGMTPSIESTALRTTIGTGSSRTTYSSAETTELSHTIEIPLSSPTIPVLNYSVSTHDLSHGDWIGLKRKNITFEWIDGSMLDFTSWNDGSPPYNTPTKDCVYFVGFEDEGFTALFRWQDSPCSELRPILFDRFLRSSSLKNVSLKEKKEEDAERQMVNISLIDSVRRGDLKRAKGLITTFGLSYSKEWSDGYALLREALINNHIGIIKLLLHHDCKVNIEYGACCDTPLNLAVVYGEIEVGVFHIGELIQSVTCNFATIEQAEEVENFLTVNNEHGVDMKVKQAVESIKLNSNLLRRDADKIHEFLLANVKV